MHRDDGVKDWPCFPAQAGTADLHHLDVEILYSKYVTCCCWHDESTEDEVVGDVTALHCGSCDGQAGCG